jgi:anti-sigma regulatory factor (Ser/Thr protein kinase)
MMPPAWSSAAEELIALSHASDAAWVSSRALAFARAAGLDVRTQWAVAIAATELSTNVVKFGLPGTLTLRLQPGPPLALEIEAADRGPGFADLDHALRDGVSEGLDRTAPGPRPMARRGLGLGLGAVQRMTDALTVRPRLGGGSIITARLLVQLRR